jgi:hypothetical protein
LISSEPKNVAGIAYQFLSVLGNIIGWGIIVPVMTVLVIQARLRTRRIDREHKTILEKTRRQLLYIEGFTKAAQNIANQKNRTDLTTDDIRKLFSALADEFEKVDRTIRADSDFGQIDGLAPDSDERRNEENSGGAVS